MADNTIRTITIALAEATIITNLALLAGILTYNKIQELKKKKSKKKMTRGIDGLHQNSRG